MSDLGARDFRPGEVWSLRKLLEKYGLLWVQSAAALNEVKWLCAPFKFNNGAGFSREVINHGAIEALRRLSQACIMSDMESVLPELERLRDLVNPSNPGLAGTETAIGQGYKHLLARVEDELTSQYFFHLTQSDVQFYQAETPFGEAAAKRFEKANEDISEAAKCLALQRPIACVFHLMRVMERGVQSYGKRMKITIDPASETWYQIMQHVDNGIKAMPTDTSKRKAKKAKFAATAAHLDHVRIAWRNEVMHPKQTYTRQEAFDLFNAVRVFMVDLAETI